MNNKKSSLTETKTWEVINSDIFRWMLGFLVLSVVPFLYKGCQQKKENSDREKKIDIELTNRINQLNARILRATDSVARVDTYNLPVRPIEQNSNEDIFFDTKNLLLAFKENTAIKNYLSSSDVRYYYSFKEFEDYSTISLLSELTALLNDQKQKDSIKHVQSLLLYDKLIPINANIPIKDSLILIKKINDSLRLKRWQN